MENKNETLLDHLLDIWCPPKDYLDLLENYQELLEDKKEVEENPDDDWDEEAVKFIYIDIEDAEERLWDMERGWNHDKDVDMEKELELIRAWVKEDEEEREREEEERRKLREEEEDSNY